MIRSIFAILVRIRRVRQVFVALGIRLRWILHAILPGVELQNAHRLPGGMARNSTTPVRFVGAITVLTKARHTIPPMVAHHCIERD